ncbi:MAG: hypothetical protein SGI96_12020 [Bacteroidota bacterium]|nr:hypothetical protein [Bacteroidota bacterium]
MDDSVVARTHNKSIAAGLDVETIACNRIYHYEPIFGNLQDIENQYKEMVTFLTWLDTDLPKLLTDIDRFDDILKKARAIYT